MARLMPILPLVGASTRFQPVFVDDIAEAVALALDGKATPGATYELGGPEVKRFRHWCSMSVTSPAPQTPRLAFVRNRHAHGERHANCQQAVPRTVPEIAVHDDDQVELLRSDNVVSDEAKASGATLEDWNPGAANCSGRPAYLHRDRKVGQYQSRRLD